MAWSVLQSAGNANDTAAASIAQAYTTANLSSGTKLLALVCAFNKTTSSVKDTALNSFTKVTSVLNNNTAAQGELSLWYLDTPSGDAGIKPTITAAFSATSGGNGIVIQEVSGLAAGGADGTPGTSFGSYSANGSAAAGSYTSAGSLEYLLACYGDNQQNRTTAAAPTGSATYTRDAASLEGTIIVNATLAYGSSAGGAETASFGVSSSNGYTNGAVSWSAILVAFQLAAGGTDATATPAVLAVTTSVPAPQLMSLTSPAYAATAADLGGGTGSWVNVTNAQGAPDTTYSTWTAP